MKRWLIGIVLILAVVVGLGFYFGYLQLDANSADGLTRITLTVDHRKIFSDEKQVEEKLREDLHPPKN